MSMKKTWSIILKVIIAVAGAIAGVVGVQAANLKGAILKKGIFMNE